MSIWSNGDSSANHNRGTVADRQTRDLREDVARGEVTKAEAKEIQAEIDTRR
jgi:hypothetical protein